MAKNSDVNLVEPDAPTIADGQPAIGFDYLNCLAGPAFLIDPQSFHIAAVNEALRCLVGKGADSLLHQGIAEVFPAAACTTVLASLDLIRRGGVMRMELLLPPEAGSKSVLAKQGATVVLTALRNEAAGLAFVAATLQLNAGAGDAATLFQTTFADHNGGVSVDEVLPPAGQADSLQQKLRELTDYKFALDHASIVAITDQKGIIRYANERFCLISGYSAEELVGRDHRIVNSGYHDTPFFRNLWGTIAKGKIWRGEIKNRRKDGSYYWVDTTIVPCLNALGKPYQYIAIRNDITDRKEAETMRREREEQFRSTFENSAVGVAYIDAAGALLQVNSQICHKLGYSRQQLLQRPLRSLLAPEVVPEMERQLQEVAGRLKETFLLELACRKQDGKVIWMKLTGSAVFDDAGVLRYFVTFFTDISERKEAELRLQIAQQASRSGFFEWEQGGTMVTVSGFLAGLFGSEAPRAMLPVEQWIALLDANDYRTVMRLLKLAAAARRENVYYEFKVTHKGQQLWLAAETTLQYDADGSLSRLVGIWYDITSKKEVELAQAVHNKHLSLLVRTAHKLIGNQDAEQLLLPSIFSDVCAVLGLELFYNFKFRDDDSYITLNSHGGVSPAEAEAFSTIALGTLMCGRVAQSRHPMVAEDMQNLEYVGSEKLRMGGIKAYAGFPLMVQGRLIGTIAFCTRHRTHFVEGEVQTIQAICDQIAASIERSRLTAELVESQKRLQTLIDSVPVMLWITDGMGHCSYLNKQWMNYTGQTLAEIQGLGWIDAVHPEEQERVRNIFIAASRNAVAYHAEFRLRKWDGTFEWFADHAEPRFDDNGVFTGYIGSLTNIQHLKLAEETLAQVTQHLHLATTSAGVGTWSLHVTTGKVEWSVLHRKMWGYDPERTDFDYSDWYKVILPEDLDGALENVNKARINRLPYSNEYRIARADTGAICWIRSVGQFIYNEWGEAVSLNGISMDITDRKFAEEALQQSEARFRTMADDAPMWVWMMDESYSVTYANKNLLRYLGREHQTGITGDEWKAHIHPDDMERVRLSLGAAFAANRSYDVEVRMLQPATNEYQWFHLRGVPHYIGADRTGYIGMGVNIHQQKNLTETLEQMVFSRTLELEQSQKFLQSVLNSTQNGIVTYEPLRNEKGGITDFRIAYINEVLTETLGRTPAEITGSTMLECYPEAKEDGSFEHLVGFLLHGTGAFREYARKQGGETQYYQSFYAPKGDGATITILDVTEQKKAALALERLNHELQRSNSDLLQFAHVASHDLKEPVRKIKTFISGLHAEVEGKLGDKGVYYMDKVLSAANRMMVMIDGVLRYSTLSANDEAFVAVDLNEVVAHIRADLEVLLAQKGAVIETTQLPVVQGVPVLLYQLIYNLVSNSLKFSREDVRPVIRIGSEWLETGTVRRVRISIADNGIGFDQFYSARIFDTFIRLNTKDKFEGTGLGLALCKKIVERHGGTICAEGVKDAGATFLIELPVATEAGIG